MYALQVLGVLLLSLLAVNAQTFHLGRCDKPAVQQNFNITQYLGTWYEIEKIPNYFEKGKCIQATYSMMDNGVIRVVDKELLPNGAVNYVNGTAKVTDPSQPAILDVTFDRDNPGGPYWILSTDYTSYAAIYSCTEVFGFFHFDFAWILSRERALPANNIEDLRKILHSSGVNVDKLTKTDQSGC